MPPPELFGFLHFQTQLIVDIFKSQLIFLHSKSQLITICYLNMEGIDLFVKILSQGRRKGGRKDKQEFRSLRRARGKLIVLKNQSLMSYFAIM